MDTTRPTEGPRRRPSRLPRIPRGVIAWSAAVLAVFAVAASIDPAPTPAAYSLTHDPIGTARVAPADDTVTPTTAASNEPEIPLGTLEGIDTTVWFYAGLNGPTATLYASLGQPIERVSLDELNRLAPELGLDSAISIMGEAHIDADVTAFGW